ncbi:MAG: endonuclease/exonuclease/phosphatase family protein [Lachnospiraceae bacterium]|nr:endonuclease/exonuclease/phosphatase family protein [Lachnospiraceae bacterium]
MNRKKNPLKTALKIFCIVLGIIIIALAAYVAYFLLSYGRLSDNFELSVHNNAEFDRTLKLDGEGTYSIMSNNVGFGAYSYDFDFFMDGGTQSWAFSKDAIFENLNGALKKLTAENPDFVMLQEVDEDSTRTYHVNELEFVNLIMKEYAYTYAYNYFKSSFIAYPFLQPHGSITSGIVTYSRYGIESGLRRSLPISESISKVLDLDRCYSISKVPMDNGKYLVLFNVHLSAYGSDDSVREGQVSMLFNDMVAEYEAGNYVICGGDFNHDLLLKEGEQGYSTWACAFPRSSIPEHFSLAMDLFGDDYKYSLDMTCRDCDEPYAKGHTNEFIVDGFIVSDNVSVLSYENLNSGYLYSDHEPVLMKFELKH